MLSHTDYTLVLSQITLSGGKLVCLFLLRVYVLICVAYIVLFVGLAIPSGSFSIDWRDTWGPILIGEGFPNKSSPQNSHGSNDQYLRSHPARGGNMCLVFGLMHGCPLHQPNTTCILLWTGLSMYVAICLLPKKRSLRKIDTWFVSK